MRVRALAIHGDIVIVWVLLSAVLGAVLVAFGMPPARRLANHLGFVDRPGPRKPHATPTPLVGMLPVGVVGAVGIASGSPQAGWIVGAMVAMAAVGLIDDQRPLRADVKLVAQAAVALTVAVAGLQIERIGIPGIGVVELPGGIAIGMTVAWLLLVMNLINLIDGMNGLAVGVIAILAATQAAIAALTGDWALAAVLAGACGAMAGVLPSNLAGRVFLGDQGTLAFGMCIGLAAIATPAKSATGVSLVPLMLVLLPLLDTLGVVYVRMRRGRAPWQADTTHLHHRLLGRGVSPRVVLACVYGWTAAAGAWSVAVRADLIHSPSLVLLGALGLTAVALVLLLRAPWHATRIRTARDG